MAYFLQGYHPSEMTVIFSQHPLDQNFKTKSHPGDSLQSSTDAKSILASEKL